IGASLLLLAGCSALRLGYNQAPHLVYWWLNGYVEFDAEQGDRARDALADWFAWHRATQLPDYAGLLATAQRQILHDVTAGEVCQWVDVLRKRIDVGYEHGVPAMAELVLTLKAPQLQRMERHYRKGDEKFRDEYLQADRAERVAESNKRARSRAEMVYGRLSDAQIEQLAQGLAASPFDPERWLAERRLRQREIIDTLRALQSESADSARTQAALRLFAAHAAQSPRQPYRDYQKRLFDHNCQLIARLHNSTTPEQRRHGADKLKGWEDDLRSLADAARL
ncbi:MAG TPA: DUF6279 family lipoprotein, partial [Burkholderiaceae bacterium]|nr:DUF6279 family lipoprotein [Burkholderiaceae bacterium]